MQSKSIISLPEDAVSCYSTAIPPSPASRQLSPSSNRNHVGEERAGILSFCSITASKSDGRGRLKISIGNKAAHTAVFGGGGGEG